MTKAIKQITLSHCFQRNFHINLLKKLFLTGLIINSSIAFSMTDMADFLAKQTAVRNFSDKYNIPVADIRRHGAQVVEMVSAQIASNTDSDLLAFAERATD